MKDRKEKLVYLAPGVELVYLVTAPVLQSTSPNQTLQNLITNELTDEV